VGWRVAPVAKGSVQLLFFWPGPLLLHRMGALNFVWNCIPKEFKEFNGRFRKCQGMKSATGHQDTHTLASLTFRCSGNGFIFQKIYYNPFNEGLLFLLDHIPSVPSSILQFFLLSPPLGYVSASAVAEPHDDTPTCLHACVLAMFTPRAAPRWRRRLPTHSEPHVAPPPCSQGLWLRWVTLAALMMAAGVALFYAQIRGRVPGLGGGDPLPQPFFPAP